MKIKINNVPAMKAALKACGYAVSGKTMPILACCHLSLDGSVLTVSTTNLDLTISRRIEVSVENAHDPAMVLNYAMFNNIVSNAAGEITIDDFDKEVKISTGKSKFNLRTRDPAEWPRLDNGQQGVCKMAAADFSRLLTAGYAVSHDDTRRALKALLLHKEKDGATLAAVSADGKRLAKIVTGNVELSEDFEDILVPGSSLPALSTVSGDIRIFASDNKMTVADENGSITTKLVDEVFPNFRHVVPADKDNPVTVTFKRADMLTALAQVAFAADEGGVTVLFGSTVTIKAQKDTALAESQTDATANTEIPVEIRLGYGLLKEMVQHLGEEITVHLADGLRPIKAESGSDLAVLMPLR